MCAGVLAEVLESITTGPHRVSAQEFPVMDNQQAEYSGLMCIVSGSFLFAQATRTTLLLSEEPGASDHSLTNCTSVFIKVFYLILRRLNLEASPSNISSGYLLFQILSRGFLSAFPIHIAFLLAAAANNTLALPSHSVDSLFSQ